MERHNQLHYCQPDKETQRRREAVSHKLEYLGFLLRLEIPVMYNWILWRPCQSIRIEQCHMIIRVRPDISQQQETRRLEDTVEMKH